ncbi:MAG TPA: secretin N-terminal domain-containing protein [Caulifigura sp.]|nr:secretin N-terminal domain-containing protein [Caulifigura sp.]
MLTRLETIRRLVLASACWSCGAAVAVSLPAHLAGAEKNPTPRQRWSPLKGRAADGPAPHVPAGRSFSVQQVAEKTPAEEAGTDETTASTETPKTQTAKIKLNYLSADWSKVLDDVAKASDSKLVPMDMPPGRFTRQDWRGLYTRTEAVRILNRELEPLGYRLLEKDQFLTVIHVQRQRMEYQRPLQASADPAAPKPLQTAEAVTPALAQNIHPRGGIQRANFEQDGAAAIAPAVDEQPVAAPAQAAPAVAVLTSQTFEPMHRTALDLSKQVLKAFDARKEMVDAGPTGLPGFEVFGTVNPETGERGERLFALELDVDADRIHIHGKADVATRIVKLLSKLDGLAAANAKEAVQVIPGDEPAAEIAMKVRPVVKQLAQFQQGAQGIGNAGTRPDAPPPPAPGSDPDVIDAVQSNVIIEVYEGSIILRGRKQDVEAVTRMIRAIETAAAGSLPEPHLVLLNHADAKQLTTIVNQIYTDLATLRTRTGATSQKQVTAIAVAVPNALLILAPQTQLDSAIKIVKEMDVPVAPGMQMQVFPLRAAVATHVQGHIETMFPAGAADSSPTALAVADIRTNSIIVMARPRDMKTIEDMINKIDRDTNASVITQRQFQLQFAVAQELAQFLSLSIQTVISPPAQQTQQGAGQVAGAQAGGAGTSQAPQELRDSKAIVLEFLSSDGNQERIVRSGLLSDVRIVAEPRTNSLMVTAPEQSMALMAELIRILDVQSRTVSEFKVIKLYNADALSAVDLLTQLFSGAQGGGGQQGQTQTPGVNLQGAADVSSSLVPIQFGADARTNSVIASGGTDAMELVESILMKLDSENALSRATKVIRLRNTAAADVELALTNFLAQIRELAQLDPERTTTNQLLQQEILVASDPATNNLLVSATPRYMDDVERIIAQLDREPDQVMIQAILVEVTLTGNCEFGVELGFQDDILFNRSSPTTNLPGFLFNNNALGNNTAAANPSKVGGQGLSNFNLGRTSSEAGFGGLVLAASSNAVSVLIRALEANSNAQVLSRPSILAVDNQIAEITVGQLVPRSQGVNFSQLGQPYPVVSDTPVGIILSVIPRITPEGKVIMELIANNSALSDQSVPIFVNADGSTVDSPIINQSRAQTTVKVPDGQTIVVGGMITSTDRHLTRKVPWLGDLPVIGHAFRFDQNVNNRTELIIFLTPRIMRRDLDAEIVKQVEAERLNFFETDVETMHGPLFGVPRPDWTPGCPPEGMPVVPGTNTPANLPPGSIAPDGQVPAGVGIPSLQLDYVPQPPVPMVEPGTNSRRVRGEYGEAFGRRPLPH